MGLAKKCDRCRNLYEPDEQNTKAVSRRYFDLCPECLTSLSNWLKNEPMTFNEIRQSFGLEPIRDDSQVRTQLYSEKEDTDD